MSLPTALFPAPDRPSSTRRSSRDDAEDEKGNEEWEDVAKVDEEGEAEEKTGEWEAEVGDASGDLSSKLLILWWTGNNLGENLAFNMEN